MRKQGTEMKRCSSCGIEKPLTEFPKRKEGTDGHRGTCTPCRDSTEAERRKKYYNPEKVRLSNLKRMYGLSPEDWQQMFDNQEGCCAVCGVHQSKLKKTLNVDHNHKTGEIRKLLCGLCNKALGLLKENPTIIRSLADYIDEYNL